MAAERFSSAFRIPISEYGARVRAINTHLHPQVRAKVKRFGEHFLNQFVKRRLSAKGVQPAGGGLARRSGDLARLFGYRVEDPGKLDGLRLIIGSRSRYAAIHEYGGVITPKKSQYLTIPLPGAQTKTGVTRGPARAFSNTFIMKSKRGNLLIMQQKGKKLIPLFVLKKSVRIPARMGLRKMWKDWGKERAKAVLSGVLEAVKRALAGKKT